MRPNSVHGRHIVLVADGRLRANDKIIVRGRGWGSSERLHPTTTPHPLFLHHNSTYIVLYSFYSHRSKTFVTLRITLGELSVSTAQQQHFCPHSNQVVHSSTKSPTLMVADWSIAWTTGSDCILVILIPFTPESDQRQISPAASASILHHIVWRT